MSGMKGFEASDELFVGVAHLCGERSSTTT
jgi:hypothetical protein